MTKGEIKKVKSLTEKKYRTELGLFIVEGEKSVLELIDSDFMIEKIFCTKNFAEKNNNYLEKTIFEIIEKEELEKISHFESNDSVLALVRQKENKRNKQGKTLVLDDIRDPGNLGTIIRICDWYGIKDIVASETTVDYYNPKVISASMGSFSRINVFYTDLKNFLSEEKRPIFGAFLDGSNIHKTKIQEEAILVVGSESNGISKELEQAIKNRITIPSYGKAESLNVAVATAIILDNWVK